MASDCEEHRPPWGSPCAQQNKELFNNEGWATLWDSKIPIIESTEIQMLGS